MVLRFELRTLHLLGICSTTSVMPPALHIYVKSSPNYLVYWARDVAQWKSACLACARPRYDWQHHKKQKQKSLEYPIQCECYINKLYCTN
jgi:hypothetical protein